MKAQKYWWLLICLTACSVFAQTNVVALDPVNFPQGKEAIWLALIPPVTFTITWLTGKIPPLPKEILPWITPLVGIGLGWLMDFAGKAELPWWSTAGAGAIAVAIFEAAKGVTNAGPKSALTPTPQTGKDS